VSEAAATASARRRGASGGGGLRRGGGGGDVSGRAGVERAARSQRSSRLQRDRESYMAETKALLWRARRLGAAAAGRGGSAAAWRGAACGAADRCAGRLFIPPSAPRRARTSAGR